MNVAARLGAFAVAAVLVFGAAFGIAAAVVPDGFSDRWQPAGGTHETGPHAGGHGDAGTGDGR